MKKGHQRPPLEGKQVGLLYNTNPTKLIRFQPGEPVLHGFKPGVEIKYNYTNEHKTIKRIEVTGPRNSQFIYITTDGERFNKESLLGHWTVVNKQKKATSDAPLEG